MSVLINGMEMPKSCDECRIMIFEDTNCLPELFCGCPIVFMAHPQGVGNRPDYCPLVEVPEQMKWIPVTERLPELHEEVLVCTEDYGETELGFATVAVYDGSGWLECWERKQYLNYVTHWMPLPEPPKEEI